MQPAPETEEEMMIEIFKYTERVVNMIRPRKLLFMAIGKSCSDMNLMIYLIIKTRRCCPTRQNEPTTFSSLSFFSGSEGEGRSTERIRCALEMYVYLCSTSNILFYERPLSYGQAGHG